MLFYMVFFDDLTNAYEFAGCILCSIFVILDDAYLSLYMKRLRLSIQLKYYFWLYFLFFFCTTKNDGGFGIAIDIVKTFRVK